MICITLIARQSLKPTYHLISWGKDEPAVLHDINIRVTKGSLTAVVGNVGSGKSSLVAAFLGELERLKGRVNTVGRIAYVSKSV